MTKSGKMCLIVDIVEINQKMSCKFPWNEVTTRENEQCSLNTKQTFSATWNITNKQTNRTVTSVTPVSQYKKNPRESKGQLKNFTTL